MVMTITFPYAARTVPSYGFPEFHSNDSPCMKIKTGYFGLTNLSSLSSANRKKNMLNIKSIKLESNYKIILNVR